MKDRIPTHPGRVKLLPVAGQANTYDMVRADGAVEVGTPLNKATLLKDTTAQFLGLPLNPDPTVNDAFVASVLMSKNACLVSVAVTVGGGPAIAGIKVNGLTALDGGACYTDSNGNVLGLSSSAEATLSTPPYADLHTTSKVISTPLQKIVSETLVFDAPVAKTIKITSTAILIFSPYTKEVDVCCVGGGGGGGCGCYDNAAPSAGSGGGGGHVANQLAVPVSANTEYTVQIGAGGSGGSGTVEIAGVVSIGSPGYGSSGGITRFLNVNASGGGSGGYSTNRISQGGGSGNGVGGNGGSTRDIGPTNGTPGTGYIFDDSSLGLAGGGGGGGAGGYKWSNEFWGGGSGGGPSGASGCTGGGSGLGGRPYGGGGGGGYCFQAGSKRGGTGGSGIAHIRLQLNMEGSAT